MNSTSTADQPGSPSSKGRFETGRRFWGRAGAALIALLFVAALYDATVSQALTNWPEHELWFFATLTRLGKADWIIYLSILLAAGGFLIRGLHLTYSARWAAIATTGVGWYIFIGMGAPSLIATIAKRVIGRARPVHLDDLGTMSFHPFTMDWSLNGFPSGHSTTAFALAVTLTALLGARWRWPLFIFAGLIALSRIVTGMHFLTDVVAGAALGTFGAMLVRGWFAARRFPIEIRQGSVHSRVTAPLRRFLSRRGKK